MQPYRSNYVDEEILNCMGRLLRHYCIEGQTERMLSDPYELRHVTDPDFEQGTAHWQVAAAEDGAVSAGQFAGYGTLQGRYPGGAVRRHLPAHDAQRQGPERREPAVAGLASRAGCIRSS